MSLGQNYEETSQQRTLMGRSMYKIPDPSVSFSTVIPYSQSTLSLHQVRALYDFDGDTDNGELCLKENDSIKVLNKVRTLAS